MATNVASLNIDLDASVEKFRKKIKSATESVEKFTAAAERVASVATKGFLGMSAAMATVSKLADKQIQSQLKLENTIKQMNAAIDPQKIYKLANAMQATTVTSDQMIISQAAVLASFGATESQLLQLLPRISDFAALLGKNIRDVGISIAKAMRGNFDILGEYGLKLNQAQKSVFLYGSEQEKVNILLELTKGAVGQAALATKTAAGSFLQLKNALVDLGEEIGFLLEQPMMDSFKSLRDTVESASIKIKELSPATKEFIAGIAMGSVKVMGLVAALAGLALIGGKAFAVLGAAFTIVVPLAKIGAVFGLIFVTMGAMRKFFKGNWISEWVDSILDGIAEVFGALGDMDKKLADMLPWGIMGSSFTGGKEGGKIGGIRDRLPNIMKEMESVLEDSNIRDDVKKHVGSALELLKRMTVFGIADNLNAITEGVKTLGSQSSEASENLKANIKVQEEKNQKIAKETEKLKEQAEEKDPGLMKEGLEEAKEMMSALSGLFGISDGGSGASLEKFLAAIGATEGMQEKVKEWVKALKEIKDAILSPPKKKAVDEIKATKGTASKLYSEVLKEWWSKFAKGKGWSDSDMPTGGSMSQSLYPVLDKESGESLKEFAERLKEFHKQLNKANEAVAEITSPITTFAVTQKPAMGRGGAGRSMGKRGVTGAELETMTRIARDRGDARADLLYGEAGTANAAMKAGVGDKLTEALNAHTEELGQFVGAVREGFAQGGTTGAIVAGGVDIVTSTENFQEQLGHLDESFKKVIGAFEPLVAALDPLFRAVGDIVTLISTALTPILTVLGTVIGAVLTPILSIVSSVAKLFAAGIAHAWNAILKVITAVLKAMSKVPVIGKLFKGMASKMEESRANTQRMLNELSSPSDMMDMNKSEIQGSARSAAESIGNSMSSAADEFEEVVRLQKAFMVAQALSATQQLMGLSGSPEILAKIKSELDDAMRRYFRNVLDATELWTPKTMTVSEFEEGVLRRMQDLMGQGMEEDKARIQAYRDMAKWDAVMKEGRGFEVRDAQGNLIAAEGPISQQSAQELADMEMLLAGGFKDGLKDAVDALGGMSNSAREASEQLLNVPTGFKTALRRFQSADNDMPGSLGGGAGGSGTSMVDLSDEAPGGAVYIENMNVSVGSIEEFIEGVEAVWSTEKAQQNGSSQASSDVVTSVGVFGQ